MCAFKQISCLSPARPAERSHVDSDLSVARRHNKKVDAIPPRTAHHPPLSTRIEAAGDILLSTRIPANVPKSLTPTSSRPYLSLLQILRNSRCTLIDSTTQHAVHFARRQSQHSFVLRPNTSRRSHNIPAISRDFSIPPETVYIIHLRPATQPPFLTQYSHPSFIFRRRSRLNRRRDTNRQDHCRE